MSFFRTHINKEIQKELFNRINSLNFKNSPQGALDPVQSAVQHQFVKSCWARASVVLGDGKNVVSLNSNLDKDKKPINEPLNIDSSKDNNFGKYRGRSGITSISSNFKDYFMKQGTINFYIPNPNDFDEFKEDFLKFGRYMLVEWGWSLPYNISLPKIDADTIIKASKNIEDRIIAANGNYTALVGVVTNYNFSQTKEGAYEGTIEISSMGRNIIGQKSSTDGKVENLVGYVNEVLAKVEDGEGELEENQKKIFRTLNNTFINFNAVIEELFSVVESYAKENNQPHTLDKFKRQVYTKPGVLFVQAFNQNETGGLITYYEGQYKYFSFDDTKDNSFAMVSWGWFEDFILNSFFSFVSKNDKVDFKTEFFSVDTIQTKTEEGIQNNNTLCRNHPDLFSLGFDSVILPGQTKDFTIPVKSGNTEYEAKSIALLELIQHTNKELFPFQDPNDKSKGHIRNMYFNVNYLIDVFRSTQNIEQSIQEFWQKVSNDYGGFWRFSLVENENIDGRMMITDINIGKIDDRSVLPDKISDDINEKYEIFKFPIYSKNSIVSDFQVQTANTSEMATMAVFGSNTKLDTTSADEAKGYNTLALRALSSLENTNYQDENITSNQEKKKTKKDFVLDNITNPVFGNFIDENGGSFVGSSATYDKGNIVDRSRTGGINFSTNTDIQKNKDEKKKDLVEVNSKTTEQKINETLFWFSDEDRDKIQLYSGRRLSIFTPLKRTMLFNINKAPGEESNYSAVLPVVPLQVSLTLQGIGGIKIGDLFYVDYLPEQYKKYAHFMVVNVEHEISTTGWTTKLDSRMIIDVPKLIKDGFASQLKKIKFKNIKDTLFLAQNEIVKQIERDNVKNTQNFIDSQGGLTNVILNDDSLSDNQKVIALSGPSSLFKLNLVPDNNNSEESE